MLAVSEMKHNLMKNCGFMEIIIEMKASRCTTTRDVWVEECE